MESKQSSDLTRRRFLQGGLTAGTTLWAVTSSADAPDPTRVPGRTFSETGGYGVRSQFADESRLALTRNGLTGGSLTPLASGHGIVTPAGLHYEAHHNGCPTIDPSQHRLLVHGGVNSPKTFTVADLMRFPSVTRFHFLECAGNGWSEWEKPVGKDVQWTHGLTSCSEWTGVRLATLLRELGIRSDAKWVLAEGGDGAGLMRSFPIEKAMDDAILAYAQNGEPLRPEQGFPLRLLVPGFEGNMNVKWLRRIELGDQPWWTQSEVAEYADPMLGGKTRVFSFEMHAKSVITTPSGGMRLDAPGFYEISGLAWSGLGKVHRVEVSTDGGGRWQDAVLQRPVLSKCHTRFSVPWKWKGEEAVLQSRVTDDSGYVQPTLAALHKVRAADGGNHNNAVQSWRIARDGEVGNVHHT